MATSEHSDSPRFRKNYANSAPEVIKYYIHDDKFNTWKVFFSNSAALPIPKIETFFSSYGDILKIDQSNPPSTFCFVHFKREEDARMCASSMKNNSAIRLRPFKQTIDRQGKPTNSLESRQSFDKNGQNGKSVTSPKTSVSDRLKVRDKVPVAEVVDGDNKSTQENRSISDTSKPPKSYEFRSSTSDSTGSIPIDPKGSSGQPGHCPSYELPDLVEKMSIGCPMKAQPLVLPITWARHHPPIAQHVTLHDVVVANIPESCNVQSILDMLEQFHPVCASNMEVIAEKLLRYCHVYFETAEQARDVEEIYDDAVLYGKSLIVQRPETLAVNADRFS